MGRAPGYPGHWHHCHPLSPLAGLGGPGGQGWPSWPQSRGGRQPEWPAWQSDRAGAWDTSGCRFVSAPWAFCRGSKAARRGMWHPCGLLWPASLAHCRTAGQPLARPRAGAAVAAQEPEVCPLTGFGLQHRPQGQSGGCWEASPLSLGGSWAGRHLPQTGARHPPRVSAKAQSSVTSASGSACVRAWRQPLMPFGAGPRLCCGRVTVSMPQPPPSGSV